ncbi:MAG: AraC family transcriptional regulator [Blastocatellia bacterium]
MNYYTISPSARLARYVRNFWVYEGEASAENPFIYRGYADGCTELVFHYRSTFDLVRPDETHEASIAAGIHAQTRNVTRWVVKRDWSIFGCYLYPYAIPRLFGFPANDLTDKLTDFRSLLGIEGSELEERMMIAADNLSRVAILSGFLEKRLERDQRELPPVFASINRIIEMRGLIDVTRLSDDFCLSHRQFERKFKELSGFSPKTYSRIARFSAALKEYGSGKSLTDIAYDCGYYDQSHFINDFKEFSGYNPKIYFSGKAEGSEYLDA